MKIKPKKQPFTANRVMTKTDEVYRFYFHCALCERGHTTGMIVAKGEDEARIIAENEARYFFNRCLRCGRWVCDEHYSIDESMCVECANNMKKKEEFSHGK